MSDTDQYIFRSERLGFRCWEPDDLGQLATINSDLRVMEFFPGIQDEVVTAAFMARMNQQFVSNRYCYFAVETLAGRQLIGFIGLSYKDFGSDFTPCTDIGWRIHPDFWNSGYATEGARAALEYGFVSIGLSQIVSMAPAINRRSIRIMEKIGMKKMRDFIHPDLIFDERLKDCVLYNITNPKIPLENVD